MLNACAACVCVCECALPALSTTAIAYICLDGMNAWHAYNIMPAREVLKRMTATQSEPDPTEQPNKQRRTPME